MRTHMRSVLAVAVAGVLGIGCSRDDSGGVAIDADDIGGVVTSANGPEAGVWVIAETQDLPTQYRKIVVTDDAGRYVLPDLPQANYRVWVRGYGLVDSEPVPATPGQALALDAVVAPTPQAAARYYPASYWFSLLHIPAEDQFPMQVSAAEGVRTQSPTAPGGSAPVTEDFTIANQAEWIHRLKRGCQACHQMGTEATRVFPANLGNFDNSVEAWERRLLSGQTGAGMINSVKSLGYDRALAMFADWTDRIAAGEVPEAPPRPQGIERNVVVTLWDYATDRAFVHDVIASVKREPTLNANGPVYGLDWSVGTLEILDPAQNSRRSIQVPIRDESLRAGMRTWSPQLNEAPSPYWGDELVWNDPVNPNQPHLDREGRVWFNSQTRPDQAPFCRTGADNPFARNFPLDAPAKGVAVYDPRTGEFELVDMCFSGQHGIFADDPDETMYFSMPVGVGWLNTRIWDETKDAEQAQGWCPAIIDYNGDGRIGAYTRPGEPADPKLDRMVEGANGYGVAVNLQDGSAWYVAGTIGPSNLAVPGKILRVTPGDNAPETCMTEVYEPPFGPDVTGEQGYHLQGIDVDTDGIVWVAIAGSVQLASFDRSKCEVLNGPTATGQHCREGWTIHPVPGPTFKNTSVKSDWYYYNWVDLFDSSGLGPNTPVINATDSDALIAFKRDTQEFVRLTVPYPMGFFTRGMDGRIDDADAGWKGRGLWAANNSRVIWHTEGGRGTTSYIAKFQIRPDPLAK